MRWLILLMAMTMGAAAQDCHEGSADILRLSEWSAEQNGDHATRVTLRYENLASKTVEMIDATAWFDDALGDNIGGIRIDRDPQLAPGGSVTAAHNMAGFQRLTKAKPENISAYICVRSVLYDDGTKEEFD